MDEGLRGAALIELEHCSLVLDGQKVLDDVSFTLRRGQHWALVGPNGSGKTFLLKMLRGDVWPTPTGRERRWYGFEAPRESEPAGSKHHIAYIGPERQDKYVRYGWNFTVAQVLTTGLFDEDIPLTRPTRAQRARVTRVLQRFGLHGLRGRRMLTLSYGQRRLTLIARAFASNASVLLLDEVFNGLDARAKEKLRKALARPRAGHDWILTSHRPAELPASVTHLAQMEGGRIVASGELRGGLTRSLRDTGAGPRSRVARRERSTAATKRGERRTGAWLVRITDADIYRDYRPVIRDLNWTIQRGEHWAVLGANGSGKSTLLSLIHGDLHPALGGTIERAGAPSGTRIEEWKRRVGWVSPELQADHSLAKSLEEIAISGRHASIGLNEPPSASDRRIARRWLRFFGIAHLSARGPRQVSYGQMRLALLARAMTVNPVLLLLDEPCAGLDAGARRQVLSVVERLARSGTQIVMAVHDVEDIVPSIRHVLKIRRDGRAVQTCTSAS